MPGQKRNEFLDGDSSEDERDSEGYDSGAEDLRKGGRSSKRRKVDSDISDDDDRSIASDNQPQKLRKGNRIDEGEEEDEQGATDDEELELPGVSKPLTKKNLVSTEAAIKKSGVVYLSRIPPFMKPTKLRSLLEPYGKINRIFLTPEDPASHSRRVRNGGNKKRSYTDGWVEFVNKAQAKAACELLNTRTIGGKKGTYYHDDVWTLLYLKGFKWHNLTEQIAAENAERASRIRAEISQATRENKEFVRNIEQSKIFETRESKKAAKRQKEGDRPKRNEEGEKDTRKQQFKQTAVAPKRVAEVSGDQVNRVLSKIF